MKVLEWQQHFSHCKSLVTISDAQGRLTPQSHVRARGNSNSSKLLWLSPLPARMKRSNQKHNFEHQFSANSVVGGGVGRKFKLVQAFMVVLVTCKNDEDQSKNEHTRVLTTFVPL